MSFEQKAFQNPAENKQEMEKRKKEWEEKVAKVSERKDANDEKIDEGILDTVVALNLFGFPTSGSCEGHLDKGFQVPWVEIEALDEPNERYENENEIYQRAAKENGITVKQLKNEKEFEEILIKCIDESEENPQKDEYVKWKKENDRLKKLFLKVVERYYSEIEKDLPEDLRIKLTGVGCSFRFYVGSQNDYFLEDEEKEAFKEKQRADLEKRLISYQKEMKNFTTFLKEKYLEQGKDYFAGE